MAMMFAVALAVALLGVLLALIPLGLRAGDKPGDTLLLKVRPCSRPRGVIAELINPGPAHVLIGMSMRRPSFRLWLEAGTYVRPRARKLTPDLMAGRQDTIGGLRPHERDTFVVPAPAGLGPRAELVLVVGQTGRLRSIHRSVRLPPLEPRPPGAPGDRTRRADMSHSDRREPGQAL